MDLAASWNNYLLSLGSAEARHRRLGDVNSVARHGLETDEVMENLTNDPDSVVLYLAPTGVVKMLFQHGRLRSSWIEGDGDAAVYVTHAGEGSVATVYEVIQDELFADVEFGAPTSANLRSTEDPTTLQAPAQNPTACSTKRCIVVPPFMVEAFLAQEDRSPASVFAAFQRAIEAFDQEHHGADPPMPGARDNCLYALQFVWACCHGIIPATAREESTRRDALEWSKSIHLLKIAPPEPVQLINRDVAESFLETSKQSLELMQQQQTLAMDRAEEKKKKDDKVNRLSRRTKQVLLFAQVDGDDVVPIDVAPTANTFFNLQTVTQAAELIRDTISEKGEKVKVSQGLATTVHSGAILRQNRTLPGGITLFALHPKMGYDTTTTERAVALTLQATHGQGLSSEAIKGLSKLSLTMPTSIDGMKAVVEYSAPLLALLFSEASPVVEFVRHVHTFIVDLSSDLFSTFNPSSSGTHCGRSSRSSSVSAAVSLSSQSQMRLDGTTPPLHSKEETTSPRRSVPRHSEDSSPMMSSMVSKYRSPRTGSRSFRGSPSPHTASPTSSPSMRKGTSYRKYGSPMISPGHLAKANRSTRESLQKKLLR